MIKLIYILGIDGLEYELVEKLNLNNLKQLEHTKIVVPIHKELDHPLSPEVWAAFLTGKYTPKHFEKPQKFVRFLLKLNRSLKIDYSKGFLNRFKNFYLENFTSANRFGNLEQKTFLDITKSYEINVPFYSFDNKTFNILYLFGLEKLSLTQSINEIKTVYEERKKQIINEINYISNSDVVFSFMHTLDVLQHLSFLHFSEVKKHYLDLDNYVSILKNNLEDTFGEINFIIVSDHGFDFEIGDHSMMGFYSSNTYLIPKPVEITDFYAIIIDLINERKEISSS